MENSLKQYIDLYERGTEILHSHSSDILNSKRKEALEVLKTGGLPQRGSENYEITDLNAMLAPDYGLNLARVPMDVDVQGKFRCGVPHLSTSLFFMLNDLWGESSEARKSLPEGVEIGPLSRLRNAELGARFGKLADITNPIVALNTLFAQEGIYIKVAKNVKVDKAVQLVNILEATIPLMAVRRLLIVLEEGAELSLISCDHSSGVGLSLASLSVAEIYVEKDSRLNFYELEESTKETSRMSAVYLSQEEGSDVSLGAFTLHNGKTRNEFHCALHGEQAALTLQGLGVETGKGVLDNYSHIRHNVKDCRTDELFKYVLDDETRGAFTGRIYVAPGASGTEAYQSNRNLLGSATARVYSKPQLEIYNDDVKCSHGSATGQLDEMQIFYLLSRGIDEPEAKFLLKQAFMADVVESVKLPILRDRLRMLLERRLSGEEVTCENCDSCND